MGTGMGYTQTLEVQAFALNGKKIFLAKLPVVDDLNPPINTLRTISEINRQNRLDLRLISPEAAHHLANMRKGNDNSRAFSEARRFFDGCGAFPSSALVCHNGLGKPLAGKIIAGKESQAALGVTLSPIIRMGTREFKGRPLVLVALGVRAQDFRKTGYLKFRLDVCEERVLAVDVGESGASCNFSQEYGNMGNFCSALHSEARRDLQDIWKERRPVIDFAYFFGGSANGPACRIALGTASPELLIVEIPEEQAKPILKIEYELEYLPSSEMLVALRRGRAP